MSFYRKLRGRRFVRDEAGNAIMLLALALVPATGLIGAAVDYSRASEVRGKIHRSADAAALAAAKLRTPSFGEKKKLAEQVVRNGLAGEAALQNLKIEVTEINGGVRVVVDGYVLNSMLGMIGLEKTAVDGMAEAVISTMETEVALVLDNTGSMRSDMPALKRAATQFTETMFGSAVSDNIKVAVVPFVAAVNPGRSAFGSGMLDHSAESRFHGRHLENREIAWMDGCNSNPFPPPPRQPDPPRPPVTASAPEDRPATPPTPPPSYEPPPPPPPPPPRDRSPRGRDRFTMTESLDLLAEVAIELFGIKSAAAQVTPRTDTPTIGMVLPPNPPYSPGGAILPTGFVWDKPCDLRNPPKISYFDLFERIDGTRWKGCVEARPEPFDVTDDPPNAFNPDTLFVPYFWPDEPGPYTGSSYANSYLDDGPLPPGWTRDGDYSYANLFKYTTAARSRIVETAPETSGPNASCPDEVLPLTSQKNQVLARIDSLNFWYGGGTINSEGVMWGWRVLSPTPPFTEGGPYDTTKKFLVLMSDGMNSFVENEAGGPTKSDYTAYGYLRNGRLPSDWFTRGEEYLDERMRRACANAKSTGIKVMTILFRETDQRTADLMRDCASSPSYAFLAANDTELRRAFDVVAGEITKLRLTK